MITIATAFAKGEFNRKLLTHFQERQIECCEFSFLEALDKTVFKKDDILVISDQIETSIPDKKQKMRAIAKYCYKARQDGARVVYLGSEADAEILEHLFTMGVYDILLNTFNEGSVINLIENPLTMGEAEKMLSRNNKYDDSDKVSKLYSFMGHSNLMKRSKEVIETGTFVFYSPKSAGATLNAINFAISLHEKLRCSVLLVDQCKNKNLSQIFQIDKPGLYEAALFPGVNILSGGDIKKIAKNHHYDVIVIDTDSSSKWSTEAVFVVTDTNPYHIQEAISISNKYPNSIPFISGITSDYIERMTNNVGVGIPYIFNLDKSIQDNVPPAVIDNDLRNTYIKIYKTLIAS